MKKIDRSYQRFTGGQTVPPGERVHVTLSHKGRILLNRNIYRMLREPEAVFLYFSSEDDTIAIEPTSPRLNGAFRVLKKAGHWVINASPFCRHNKIHFDTTEKFVHPNLDGGNLYLNLRETVTVSGMRKKRRPKNQA